MLHVSQNHERACTLGVHEEPFGQVLEVSCMRGTVSSRLWVFFSRFWSVAGLARRSADPGPHPELL